MKIRKPPSGSFLVPAVLLIWCALVYLPHLGNGLLSSWDDNRYILNNRYIHELSPDGIAQMFSVYYDGHYHPLTLVSLAVDWSISGTRPFVYHLTNLLLHLAVVLMVWLLARRLIPGDSIWPPFVTALLFGICTLHVETVAWATERKNLLYAFFFFWSLLVYHRYLESRKNRHLAISLLLFLLSLLSKVPALMLAFTLPVMDYLHGRDLRKRNVWFEKIPFLAFSLLFSLSAVWAQRSTWGEDLSQISRGPVERIIFASDAFFLYIIKLFIPFRLSAYYPYPTAITPAVWAGAAAGWIFAAAGIYAIVRLWRREPVIVAGLLFFAINIALLLKVFEVPAGDYFMAERYAYLPSFGLFLASGFLARRILPPRSMRSRLLVALTASYLMVISLVTLNRALIWKNEDIFFGDMIRKYPEDALGYTNRGACRKQEGKLAGALSDFTRQVELSPESYKGWANRGAVHLDLKDFDKAARDFRRAVALNPDRAELLASLGFARLNMGEYHGAIMALDSALARDPTLPDAFLNRGTAWFSLGNLDKAAMDYGEAIRLRPDYVNALFNRGLVMLNMNRTDEAISQFNSAININPRHAQAYANRAIAWSRKGIYEKAFADYNTALQINPGLTEALLNRGIDRYQTGDMPGALDDLNRAISVQPSIPAAYYFRGLAQIALGDAAEGCNDLKAASKMGFRPAEAATGQYCK
ncbi:MAG: tetratricopeptide repeat protein [Bacteroidales bacterium]|nr:tetratricopeptide repeat protein [Bacteroidales bacterium]